MKRWPPRILICLILLTGGAITTVAVGWGCQVFGFEERDSGDWGWREVAEPWSLVETQRFLDHLRDQQPELIPNGYSVRDVKRYRGFGWTILQIELQQTDTFALAQYRRYRTGWPLAALESEWTQKLDNTLLASRGVLFTDRLDFALAPMLLPFYPTYGLVIDTLFYGAIWFGVFFGFTSAKKFIRTKRGRCPRCGYDLRGQRLVISDQRLAISGQQPSADSPIRCSECGWGRAEKSD